MLFNLVHRSEIAYLEKMVADLDVRLYRLEIQTKDERTLRESVERSSEKSMEAFFEAIRKEIARRAVDAVASEGKPHEVTN